MDLASGSGKTWHQKGNINRKAVLLVPTRGMAAIDSSAVWDIKFLEWIWDGKLSAKSTPPRHLQAEARYLPGAGTNPPLSWALGSSLILQPTEHHVLVRITFTRHLALVKGVKWFFHLALLFFCVLFSSLLLGARHKQDSIKQNVMGNLLRATVLGTLFTVQMKHIIPGMVTLEIIDNFTKKHMGTPWCKALRKN